MPLWPASSRRADPLAPRTKSFMGAARKAARGGGPGMDGGCEGAVTWQSDREGAGRRGQRLGTSGERGHPQELSPRSAG